MNNPNSGKKFLRGYVAAVLDADSAAKLKSLAKYPNVFCHHLTLAYQPDIATLAKYNDLIGKKVKLMARGIAMDDRAQAVLVEGCLSENAHPHITISCQNGTVPAYSNELLDKGKLSPLEPIELDAKVEIVRF